MMKQSFLFMVLLLGSTVLSAQSIIELKNPSLEGQPQHSRLPKGWDDCGYSKQSPPDTQPSGDFGVYREAQEGNTYVGMVVRDNDTWECMGQTLKTPFRKNTCYQMSVLLGKSRYYLSMSLITNQMTNYSGSCVLRLWGGFQNKDGYEMLTETDPVHHFEWKEYVLEFTPPKDYDYLYIEAYYADQGGGPYCGNMLIDHFSPIVPCEMIGEGQSARDFE